ncbi:MAG: 2'-5' RNA ligase family protein [Pseudomonadota bacterium]
MIPANFHITLVFVGAVAAEARQALEDAAARIAARSFVLTLDHFGYWRKPQIFMGE